MTLKEIKKLHNSIITTEQFSEILETPDAFIDIVGTSSQFPSCTWFDVELYDGTNIDVFLKAEMEVA